MNIEIWSIGKENETFIDEGVQVYFKKIKPYCPISLVILQLPKKLQSSIVEVSIKNEEELILKRLQAHHYLVLMDEGGKLQDSPTWAKQITNFQNQGIKTLVILIGGAYGVSQAVKKAAKQTWSLSPLVFPHQLVRLILAEQVYRAFSIIHNSPYHHA